MTQQSRPSWRPENHVTRALSGPGLKAPDPGGFADLERCPEITAELLDFLHLAFPHRVYNPRGETLEEHLVYAGHVGLVEYLEAAHEYQRETHPAATPQEDPESWSAEFPDDHEDT